MAKAITWLINHRKVLKYAILSLSGAFLLSLCINLHKTNKKLSERLEMAQNNVEAYQGLLSNSQQANSVLRLTVDELQHSNDSLIQKVHQQAKQLSIKPSTITTAATQTQQIIVNQSKEILRDTIYTDSIKYNDLTSVYYTIGPDTINIGLDIRNTQYLYTIKKKEYKRNKKFIMRILTLDFKKVWKYQYKIVNTNELINTSDVRILEIE